MSPSALQTFLALFGTRNATRTEADVQTNMAAFLTTAKLGLTTSQVTSVEEPLGDGTRRRIDIAFGKLIIEVKRDLTSGKTFELAVPQLAGYLDSRFAAGGSEYAGIITDGVDWHLFGQSPGGLTELDRHSVDPEDAQAVERLRLWLETILLTGKQLKAGASAVRKRLGTESPRFKLDRSRLEALYNANASSPELALKRHLWARLLRTALGTSFEDTAALFIDHTLLVVEAEIIAHLVIQDDPALHSAAEVVGGHVFRKAGITNVVEEDFFDWVAEVAGGADFVSDLIRELKQFDWSNVEHDVLKVLYEAIIDKDVRKNLGEYYTPDWLAAKIVGVAIADPMEQRVMDPACGSGTFVFHAVRRYLARADELGMPNRDALNQLQDRVFGMDIHPVSVVLARVTYLLAIGAERLGDRDALTIPVYLGDSMQWTRGADTIAEGSIRIEVETEDLATSGAESQATLFDTGVYLDFPLTSIADPGVFDRMVSELADLAQSHTVPSATLPNAKPVLVRYGVTDAAEQAILLETFETLASLNVEGRDHIWGYFVRNQVRPIWFSIPERRVDVLVGNPPWVAYRFMTAGMQKQFKVMSERRNLWVGGKVSTQQDLVGLFIARTVEQFLKPQGNFAFVTPFAVLSRMQYAGFRSGRWADEAPDGLGDDTQTVRASLTAPWDLSGVKPAIFPVPSAVVFGTKTADEVPLPSEASRFAGKVGELMESSVSIAALNAKQALVSPYGKRAVQGATVTPRFLFMVEQVAASNLLGQPQGQVTVKSVRSELEKKPWKKLPDVVSQVESKFVFELLQGTSVAPYRVLGTLPCVLPIEGGKILRAGESGMSKNPLLAQRWSTISGVWDANKKSKLSLLERIDYQKGLARQLPAEPQRVVYTTSGTRLASARTDDTRTIVDTSLYWVSVSGPDEGRYLTAVLNSDHLAKLLTPKQALGLFGPRHFHTLPFTIPIPAYDPCNVVHSKLAAAGQEAETAAAALTLPAHFVTARNAVRASLRSDGTWGRIEALVQELLPES